MASLKIFGIDLSKINWYLVMYVLLSIGIVYIGMSRLSPFGSLRANIYAVGAAIVMLLFYYRWFSGSKVSKAWPPTMNMCPDYLTFVPKVRDATSVSGGACVDMLGVTTKEAGIVKTVPSDLASLTVTNTNKVFEYTSADVKAATNASQMQLICTRCQIAGVTWEGVFDGDSCMGLARWQDERDALLQCQSASA